MRRCVMRRKLNFIGAGLALSAMAFLPGAYAATQPISFTSVAPEDQALELAQWFKSEKLVALPDETVVQFFKNLPVTTYCSFLKLSAFKYREAEFWVRRQERLPQGWTEQPVVNYIKFRYEPRQVYVSWLEGGPGAGREAIYNETVNPDKVYGHAAGVLGVQPFWVPLDSFIVKRGSNYSPRDMGIQHLADTFESDSNKWLKAGGDGRPSKVEVLSEAGHRLIAVTWERPLGKPTYNSKRIRLSFDLRKVYVRVVEVWEENGQMRERLIIDNALARNLTESDFSPTNPAYNF